MGYIAVIAVVKQHNPASLTSRNKPAIKLDIITGYQLYRLIGQPYFSW